MSKRKRIWRAYCIHLINRYLCGTHFFGIKRMLLNSAGIVCENGTCVVGPLYIGNTSKVRIGSDVWIGRNFTIHGNGEVTIKNNIDIAPEVVFLTGSHMIGNKEHRAGDGVSYCISVENGCWIGARASIMGNTIIKSGSIIAVGAVINETVGPNAIYGGVPAKEIRLLDEN